MLFILLIFYIYRWDAQAVPIPTASSFATSASSLSKRSMFSIVSSCISTVFICAWVSVHPNVPPRSQSRALWRRLKLMFWTIVVPELVLAWAVRQWYGARMISNKYKGHGWTMTHGHFLIMGGFTLAHANVNIPKEPTRPKLSLMFRFWRNADGVERQGTADRNDDIYHGRVSPDQIFIEQGSLPRQSIPDGRSSSGAGIRVYPHTPGDVLRFHSPIQSRSSSSSISTRQVYPVRPMRTLTPSISSTRRSVDDVGVPVYGAGWHETPKIWNQKDEQEYRNLEQKKHDFEEERKLYESEKRRYMTNLQYYDQEKKRHHDEKRRYENSQKGEEDRWRYEKSRQRFELVRRSYEDERDLYEESQRQYQDKRQSYLKSRDSSKDIKRLYGEIRKKQNGAEAQRKYEKAKALYTELTKRHDKQQKHYEDLKHRHKQARRDYEEARNHTNDARRRNRSGRHHSHNLDEKGQSYHDSEETTYFEEKKRLYRAQEDAYEKARKHYQQEKRLHDEATERYKADEALYDQDHERMTEEANQRYQQDKQRIDDEDQQHEEEKRQYAEERERYERARRLYERERQFYEEERLTSNALQHVTDELDRQQYENERRQYEEQRQHFEEEWYNEEQRLRRYEEELHRYKENLKEYEEKCRYYRLGSLSFDLFQRLVYESKIVFPTITVEEINDKSKADLLSKVIAILQTTWFVIQCIARGAQGLAITELELVTLALASLNAATYACWWNKPLGVQDPTRIYLNTAVDETPPTRSPEPSVSGAPEVSITKVLQTILRLFATLSRIFLAAFGAPFSGGGACCGHFFLLVWLPCSLVFVVVIIFLFLLSFFPLAIAILLKIIKPNPPPEIEISPTNRQLIATRIIFGLRRYHYDLSAYISGFFQEGFSDVWNNPFRFLMGLFIIFPLFFIVLVTLLTLLLPFFTLSFTISFLFTAVFGIVTTNVIKLGATQVPSFYAYKTDSDRYTRMIVFAFFGVIFGGLHCIGWNFSYPTSFERVLWRLTSLLITFIPVIVAPIDYFLANVKENPKRSVLSSLALSSLDLAMTIILFAYVPARLSLIAQAFALLRIQPPTAFIRVDWTAYIPHIFTVT